MRRLLPFLLALSALAAGAERPTGDRADGRTAKATFAGGCFWCMEPPFEKLDDVIDVVSGYMGGSAKRTSYKQVSAGLTEHAEVVQITYDPSRVSYDRLLYVFWRNIDPTTLNRQFADKGAQYRTAIFYHSGEQKLAAEASKRELERTGPFKKPIVTEITAAGPFHRAEEYHQDYYKKNPLRYKWYRYGSGRDGYLKRIWGPRKETSP